MSFTRRLAIAMTITILVTLGSTFAAAQYTEQSVDGITFQVPEGMRLEKVAASPLVERPIVAAWDAQGRLLVLEAAGPVAREAEAQGARPHRLVRLVDENGDGRFDRRIVAAEDLSFPVGVLAVREKILVSAPPEIWALTDHDGDGVCEQREVWLNPGTATHCYNDLHGPYPGRDGWIYWTKGAFAEQALTLRDGETLRSTAAHIYRRRLEGGPIEAVMTGGMDNPVELAITPAGERFFTSTFLQYPAGGRRDGIAHAIYGGLYGKSHDVLNGHWKTGNLMPIMTHLGPAAPSGLALAERTELFRDSTLLATQDHAEAELTTLIAAQFNLQRVSLHRLVPQGASFRTEDLTLLSTDWVQFHPTDVLEDCDGSWLVLDTGGWYDLCCPSLALDQSVAVGGIYRLTSASTDKVRKSIAGQAPVPEDRNDALSRLLNSSAWLQRNAADWLVNHSAESLPEVISLLGDTKLPLRHRQILLWLLCQVGNDPARQAITRQLASPQAGLRQAAAMAIATHRWPESTALETALAVEQDAPAARALAEALGRVGSKSSIAPLMNCLARLDSSRDRALQHSLTYALIELNQSDEIAAFLDSPEPSQLNAALRALHERSDSRLTAAVVLPALNSPGSRDTAIEILTDHPEWSADLGDLLPQLFKRAAFSVGDRDALLTLARQWGGEPAFQKVVGGYLQTIDNTNSEQITLLVDVIRQTRPDHLPTIWSSGLATLLPQLTKGNEPQALALLDWLSALTLTEKQDSSLVNALRSIGSQASPTATAAIGCLPAGSSLPEPLVERLVHHLESANSGEGTRPIWLALQRVQIDSARLERITATAASWDLANIGLAVRVFAEQASDDLNLQLLERLEPLPLAKALPPDQLRELFRPRGQRVFARLEAMLDKLAQPPADVQTAVDELLEQLPVGDPLRGLQVFRSTQAACSSCHQIAYVGGQIGPDLSRIGATRTRRELLEAIAFPSSRQEQSYRAEKFSLVDGRVLSGLVEERGGEVMTVRTGVDQRTRIRLDEIDQRLPSELSLMPAGIIDALAPQQLADLLAFLESRR